jgi:hypothetical protein
MGSVKTEVPPYGFGLGVAVGGTEVAVGGTVAVAVAIGPTVLLAGAELLAVVEHAANDTPRQATRISTWSKGRGE